MQNQQAHHVFLKFAILLAACIFAAPLQAQDPVTREPEGRIELPTDVLTADKWKEVDQSVDRALTWLITQQKPDGSFPTIQNGQPGVTSLCMMAFLSQGHLPGEGKYGDQMKLALEYIVSCQKPSGVLSASAPNQEKITRAVEHQVGYTSVYNHAIAALVLCECYAMAGPEQTKKIEPAIEKALAATYQMQDLRKVRQVDAGGWRYLNSLDGVDSDLSLTGWQLMFLRSAKNAGFDVDKKRIDVSVAYVRRCFSKTRGTFLYKVGFENRPSRGVAGSGILALAHAGLHNTPEAIQAGNWILKSGFQTYNEAGRIGYGFSNGDRYHYGLLTSSQAMYQLGGRHWREFFPLAAQMLLDNQKTDGSWPPERLHNDGKFGNAYTTAVGVIALSPTNQLLPIFQR